MKILYVQEYLGRDEPLVMPIGLLYIVSAASSHEGKLLDMNAVADPYGELAKTIREYDPEVVALSVRNIDNQQRLNLTYYYLELPKTLSLIKETKPDATLVLGGAGFSMFADTIMRRHSDIDFGIFMEGETAFPALLQNLKNPQQVPNLYYRKNGTVKFTGRGEPVDISNLPFPPKDIIPDIKIYASGFGGVGIHTKRGCPYRCAYCNYYTLNGNNVRMRDPITIVDEIEDLVNNCDIRQFIFADGVFSNPFQHVKAICDEIKRRHLKVSWAAWCEIKDINDEFLDTIISAGCNFIVVSPDAYSNGALKGLNKGITTGEVRKAIKLILRRPELKLGFGFFMTAPGETVIGYLKTLLYFFSVVPLIILRRKGGGGFSWVRMEPETTLLDTAAEDGLIKPDTDLLPADIESLRKLFYVNPKLRFLDPLSKLIVGGAGFVRKFVRPKRARKDLQ